jgi:hypothetical protein
VCASLSPALGFSAHVVDRDRPFSETGSRSFYSCRADVPGGATVDDYCLAMVDAMVKVECKGRLKKIAPEYRTR